MHRNDHEVYPTEHHLVKISTLEMSSTSKDSTQRRRTHYVIIEILFLTTICSRHGSFKGRQGSSRKDQEGKNTPSTIPKSRTASAQSAQKGQTRRPSVQSGQKTSFSWSVYILTTWILLTVICQLISTDFSTTLFLKKAF